MFDTIKHEHVTRVTNQSNRIDVHEHKAPTDESIKLLNEMQEKAMKNVIALVKVQTTLLKDCVVIYVKNPIQLNTEYFVKYNLNGVQYEIKGEIDTGEFSKEVWKRFGGLGFEQIHKHMHEHLSATIAKEIIKHCAVDIQGLLKN